MRRTACSRVPAPPGPIGRHRRHGHQADDGGWPCAFEAWLANFRLGGRVRWIRLRCAGRLGLSRWRHTSTSSRRVASRLASGKPGCVFGRSEARRVASAASQRRHSVVTTPRGRASRGGRALGRASAVHSAAVPCVGVSSRTDGGGAAPSELQVCACFFFLVFFFAWPRCCPRCALHAHALCLTEATPSRSASP